MTHTEATDDYGDVEIAGYLGASKQITEKVGLYGEIYGVTTAAEDIDFSGKLGANTHSKSSI